MSYSKMIKDLINYSNINYDIRHIKEEASYYGADSVHLAEDLAEELLHLIDNGHEKSADLMLRYSNLVEYINNN